ncbi:MAG: dihydrodipicolinate synthase family protein [Geminicoccaceae bacterium]|nr:dihydrodipicolinate synthase family protein [Geminicoccaceae bacterium]
MKPVPGGIHPIVYAFFDGDDRLDRHAMRRQAEACIAAGSHGIAALGLATEVRKLTPGERRQVMHWLIEDVAGRLPVAITIYGRSVDEQAAFVAEAAATGAAWVILQPPPERIDEAELIRFFGRIADRSPVPVAIQNAPQYIGFGLTADGIIDLCRQHANVRLLKAEASAVELAHLHATLGDTVSIFNGRGGLELPDILRAGCAGLIPAPELLDIHLRIHAAYVSGDAARADALYAQVLPCITFLMQSVDQFLCYGKRITARRLGLEHVNDRDPCQKPDPFGLACMERYSRNLPAFD